jgi:hypothetical protein
MHTFAPFRESLSSRTTGAAGHMLTRRQPLRHTRYSCDTDMTVCIAAATIFNDDPLLVLCMDMMGSTDSTSSETTFKWQPVGDGFSAMIAGTVSAARELVSECHSELLKIKPQTIKQVLAALRTAAGTHKRNFAEAHVQNQLGLSYQVFLDTGKQSLPTDLFRELARDIAAHDFNAEAIISGFLGGKPVIFVVNGESVYSCDDFAVIGSGSDLAEAALYHRDQNFTSGANRTMYCVYEAKRLAERAPGVGRKTQMFIVRPDSTRGIEMQGFDVLDDWFKQYGPQPVPGLVFPDKHFVDFPPLKQEPD